MNRTNDILKVENFLKNMDESAIKVSDVKRKLSKEINSKDLMKILNFLENKNKIVIGSRGVTWIHSDSHHLKRMFEDALEI